MSCAVHDDYTNVDVAQLIAYLWLTHKISEGHQSIRHYDQSDFVEHFDLVRLM